MRLLSLAALMLMGTACAAAPPAAPTKVEGATIDRWDPAMDAIVPKDWKIEKLAEGFGWAEGPIWVKSGSYLLFTDVTGNKMW
jgi:gluconolactonase